MKKFIDENGIFEIEIPSTWKYSLLDKKVHTFQDFKPPTYDTFQISFTEIDGAEEKEKYFLATKDLPKTIISKVAYRSYPEIKNEEFTTKTWTTVFGNIIVLFSLTFSDSQQTQLDDRISLVQKIISGFKLIEKTRSEIELDWHRLDSFIQGVGATEYMIDNAVGHKCFIEVTCLFASQIDALLRIGIVLQEQINNKNSSIDKAWIYQSADDKKKSEKEVYNTAKELGILDARVHDDLYELYEERNRVVHRFIISEITAAEIEQIAFRYYLIKERINKIVYNIENKQIELNLGMTRKGKAPKGVDYHRLIRNKMGGLEYFEKKEQPTK